MFRDQDLFGRITKEVVLHPRISIKIVNIKFWICKSVIDAAGLKPSRLKLLITSFCSLRSREIRGRKIRRQQ